MSLQNLTNKYIIKNSGFFISDDFDRMVQAGKIKSLEVDQPEAAIQYLFSPKWRYDGYIGNEIVTRYLIQTAPTLKKYCHNVAVLRKPVTEKKAAYFVLALHSSYPQIKSLGPKAAAALTSMEKEGVYKAIVAKYVTEMASY